jgi:hypothetical protein
MEIQKGAVAKSYMTNGLLNPQTWLNICAFPHILGSLELTIHVIKSQILLVRHSL